MFIDKQVPLRSWKLLMQYILSPVVVMISISWQLRLSAILSSDLPRLIRVCLAI